MRMCSSKMKSIKHLPEVIVVALSSQQGKMIQICILKGEYKEEKQREGGNEKGKPY